MVDWERPFHPIKFSKSRLHFQHAGDAVGGVLVCMGEIGCPPASAHT
ncbi:MAG: hypothetical protein GY943_17080 [Chloroflexi bacterium]|nr:hypothetical protein [Chloroflexota bacterium]